MLRGPAPQRLLLCTLFATVTFCCMGSVRAEDDGIRLGLVSDPRLSPALRKQLERTLARRYPLQSASPALGADSVRRAVTQMDVEMLMVATIAGRVLTVRCVDAQSGRALGRLRLRLQRGALGPLARSRLLRQTTTWIGQSAPAEPEVPDDPFESAAHLPERGGAGATDASAEDIEDESSDEPADPDQSGDAATQSDGDEPLAARDEDEDSTDASGSDAAGSEPSEMDAPDSESESEPEAGIDVTALVGLGTLSRAIALTTRSGPARLDTGFAFAIDLGLTVAASARAELPWLVSARYQTSLGLELQEQHVNGMPRSQGVRSHRFELGAGLRLPIGEGGWALSPRLGYALRSIAPEVHYLLLPFYTVGGPFARVELSVPLGDRAGLQLSPELQWLPQASGSIGGPGASGLRWAIGGQVGAFLRLGASFSVEITFRESHAALRGGVVDLNDVERLVFLGATWRP